LLSLLKNRTPKYDRKIPCNQGETFAVNVWVIEN
jgi:hypothetical protein